MGMKYVPYYKPRYNRRMKKEWEVELEAALRARKAGNEGRARVCARRAAGAVARKYLKGDREMNAYEALLALKGVTGISPELWQAADHLTMRVNEIFRLPVDVDLLADARILCESLNEE